MKVNIKRPFKNYSKPPEISVTVESHDTWNLDVTLAKIISPCLKQLKEQKTTFPMVDLEDVPKELQPTRDDVTKYNDHGSVDSNFDKRYVYIIDEIIWTFNRLAESDYDDKAGVELSDVQTRIENGLRLFAKYYLTFWT